MDDGQSEESRRFERIAVIINPAAGQDRPILGVMNARFHEAGVEWQAFVTSKPGDAHRHAREAVRLGFPVVAVHGGDGSVNAVASALVGTGVPLAIFPGGTANVMSVELGIPSDLAEACALVFGGAGKARWIDVGQIDDRYFLLRVGIGFEAQMVEGADGQLKGRLGTLAYALSALRAIRQPTVARYRLTLDGERHETEGITCIIANAGSLGRGALTLAPTIDVGDGLLDVLVVRRNDLAALLSVAASVLTGAGGAEPLQHWQARHVAVDALPPQPVTVDGEVLQHGGAAPIRARVLPRALQVIVPALSETVTEQQSGAKRQIGG